MKAISVASLLHFVRIAFRVLEEGVYCLELHTSLDKADMFLRLKGGQEILVYRNGDVFVDAYTSEEIDGAIEDLRRIVKVTA